MLVWALQAQASGREKQLKLSAQNLPLRTEVLKDDSTVHAAIIAEAHMLSGMRCNTGNNW